MICSILKPVLDKFDDRRNTIDLGDMMNHCEVRIKETISPYKASASPKIKIRIIPTNILSC